MPTDLDRLYDQVGEYPAVNQIELHPTFQQRQVVEYSQSKGLQYKHILLWAGEQI